MGLEDIEQIKLFDWIRNSGDLSKYCIHIANERRTSVQHARKLKRMGVKKGVADVFVAIGRRGYYGMWIELKVGKNTLSESQENFMHDMTHQNFFCVESHSYEEARTAIETYVGIDISEGKGVDLVLDFTDDFNEIDKRLHGERFGTIFCFSVMEALRTALSNGGKYYPFAEN